MIKNKINKLFKKSSNSEEITEIIFRELLNRAVDQKAKINFSGLHLSDQLHMVINSKEFLTIFEKRLPASNKTENETNKNETPQITEREKKLIIDSLDPEVFEIEQEIIGKFLNQMDKPVGGFFFGKLNSTNQEKAQNLGFKIASHENNQKKLLEKNLMKLVLVSNLVHLQAIFRIGIKPTKNQKIIFPIANANFSKDDLVFICNKIFKYGFWKINISNFKTSISLTPNYLDNFQVRQNELDLFDYKNQQQYLLKVS